MSTRPTRTRTLTAAQVTHRIADIQTGLTRAEETYAALNEVANKHQVQFDKEYAALKEVDNTQQVQIDEQKVEMDRQKALINEQQVEIDNNKKSQVHDVARVDQHLSEHSSTLRSTTYNVGSLTKDVKSLREDADSFKEKAACFDEHEKEIKALKDGRELFEKRLAQKILRRDAIRQERIAAAYHQMAKDELREIEVEEDEALTIPGLYLVPAIAYTSLSSDKKRKAEDGEGRDGSDGGDREAKKGRLVE